MRKKEIRFEPMGNRLEKMVSAEKQVEFRKSLVDHILERSLPEILKLAAGRNVQNRDIANVLRPILDQYRESSATRVMSGTVKPEEWESFENWIMTLVDRKLREIEKTEAQRKKSTPKNPSPHTTFHQRTLFPMIRKESTRKRKLS